MTSAENKLMAQTAYVYTRVAAGRMTVEEAVDRLTRRNIHIERWHYGFDWTAFVLGAVVGVIALAVTIVGLR